MESQILKVVVITVVTVVVVQLIFLYLRSIFIKYVTGFRPMFNPFERLTGWYNKDWLQGELYGRASTIQKYGLITHCTETDIDAVKEIEKWGENKKTWDSLIRGQMVNKSNS